MSSINYLLADINTIKGVGLKTTRLFKKKNINTVFDLIYRLPRNTIDRTDLKQLNQLEIGKIQTITVKVKKYNFPRIRNLPNRVLCEDKSGKIECVFFNSYEGYIRKILPLNAEVTISGKIRYFKKMYQITNPIHISKNKDSITKLFSNYSLTDGLGEKKYKDILNRVLKNIPNLDEWLDNDILKKFDYISWKEAILELHNPENTNKKGNFLSRLIFDEIISNFLVNSKIRAAVKKVKKNKKKFNNKPFNDVIKKIDYRLTNDQINSIKEINIDLKSNKKMFRLLQGDVGSGKTIVSLIASLNVIKSGYQVAFMAPTEILAKQHVTLAKKLFHSDVNVKILTSKTEIRERYKIIDDLLRKKIDLLIGTHSLFQEKIIFKNLGLIIVDEQHKFGVRQRKKLSDKGGKNCDILVMSATPIPRTMIMTIFGDMDVSIIREKPKNRKPIKTYSKLDNNIPEIIKFVKNQIDYKNQVFWVCPLIEESKKINHQSAVKRYNDLQKIFNNRVGLLHGLLTNEEKNNVLQKFLNKKIDILVSTTVIEVGIDFPNANTIIIENSNKFGLSQLHQLRGRVGRGSKESYCILLFKSTLSENAKKRIIILKKTNDGFKISEEDMKLRGYGDLLGFKQSGLQTFRLADPVLNEDLFIMAEKKIKDIESRNVNFERYLPILKMFDRADILNDLV